ncbi:MAG: hypothetical protein EBX52_09830 [Proteobacteria bacterium]|nr:hypothetical protein [Pseudomonadota bacterium]
MANSSLFLTVLLLIPSLSANAATCTHSLDSQSLQVNWTAFKTTAKVPVKGSFAEVALLGDLESTQGVPGLLSGLDAEIDLKDEKGIRTGNPARDLTLFKHFFGLFKKSPLMKGEIRSVHGDDHDGSFELHLTLNQKTRPIPMHYRRDAKGAFEATGNLDVLDFGLSGPFEDLHQTCKALHTGNDGISKTWSQVVLKIEARISEKCGS